jgi:hypothetical protein
MSAWHDGIESFVPQEMGSQVVTFDLCLFNPGDGHVEAPFGHPNRLRV